MIVMMMMIVMMIDGDCGGYATQKQKQQKSRWMQCIALSLSRMNGGVEGGVKGGRER